MQKDTIGNDPARTPSDVSIGRIVSVTGSKAIVLLDGGNPVTDKRQRALAQRPEMGTLLAIDTSTTVVLAIVSALSVPVPAQREGDTEIWIAELGLVGELWRKEKGGLQFNRGVTVYPSLGDRVRVSNKHELEHAFCGDTANSVRVGAIKQDSSIPAMIRVDDLLGKHFAILGTTGTGKSCTTALILRCILEKNPAAHIVLLDPHNEYATAFPEWAEVINPRNMQLPYWLLTFEELVEVLLGGTGDRRQEIEILQELIPVAKGRYSVARDKRTEPTALRRGQNPETKYTVDSPVPYRTSDLISVIDERMGKLENKRDISPYRNLKTKIDTITQDPRYAFMFGSLTVFDGMAQILGRLFRVPVNNKPITILELTGIPHEIVNVVVSVVCRMTFDFALWSEGQVPVTIVCEEAHRYVPANPSAGFEPCKRAIAKIAKEGRKYGSSLCIVTQRPSEIDSTILSQCNTVFALRMSNDRDQEIVTSAISDTGAGLLEFLSALGQREAIAFGDGVSLPVRIRFDELPKACMPRSSTARFSEKWQHSTHDESFLDAVVERWRASSSGSTNETHQNLSGLAESMGSFNGQPASPPPRSATPVAPAAAFPDPTFAIETAPVRSMPATASMPAAEPAFAHAQAQAELEPAFAAAQPQAPAARPSSMLRDPSRLQQLASRGEAPAPRPTGGLLRREPAIAAPTANGSAPAGPAPTVTRSLRDKLLNRVTST